MDNQEAKFILRAYRASGADASDPVFSGALEQARRDPELATWLKKEQALDRAVSQKMRSVVPPSGLRETILAGARVSHVPSNRGQRAYWYGLAASIALAIGLAVGWPQLSARTDVATLTNLVINDTVAGRHGSEGEPAGQLQQFLSDPSVKLASATMPVDFEKLRATGCRTLSLAGRDLVEVCFLRGGKGYHLYVMTRMDQVPRVPRLEERSGGGAAAAAWSDERHSFILATVDGATALRSLF